MTSRLVSASFLRHLLITNFPPCLSPRAGQIFSQNLANVRDQSKTGEGSPDDDDSYLGYSVASGEFDGDAASSDVAVGMPRGAELQVGGSCYCCCCQFIITYYNLRLLLSQGKVLIYDSRLTNLHNLTGDQVLMHAIVTAVAAVAAHIALSAAVNTCVCLRG